MLRVRGLCKRFGSVVANDNINLELAAGEGLAILGENGAGKSTLMHMLSGLLRPDSGEISIDQHPVRFRSPQDAKRFGIGMVHQHFRLAGALSVEDNLALGELNGSAVLQRSALRRRAAAIASQLGLSVPWRAAVGSLGVAEQQRVEILKTLLQNPRVLILDEPTAVLPPDARDGLFTFVRNLTAAGTAVLLSSHRLEDVQSCCSRVMVLRQGREMAMLPTKETSSRRLVHLMFGTDEALYQAEVAKGQSKAEQGAPLVEVRDLKVGGRPGVRRASFQLKAGELLALCGVDGNGQSELIEALAGMTQPIDGELIYRIDGQERRGPLSPSQLCRLGAVHIPEDRLRYAVVPQASLVDNWRLTTIDDAAGSNRTATRRHVRNAIETFDIRAASIDQKLASLSGGNQQKFVVARELAAQPRLILAANVTRGVDIHTSAAITKRLMTARNRGAAILLLSSDLDDVWPIADRIMVMTDGILRGPVHVAASSKAEIGHWMTRA